MAARRVTIKESKDTGSEASSASSKKKDGWDIPARYELRELLGFGSYGNVREAKDVVGKRKVAIKQAHGLFDDLMDAKRVLREISILGKLDHPHVIRVYDVVVPVDLLKFNELYMVLELCDSDLKKLLRANVTLNSLHVTTLLYNLMIGLNYLHSLAIWHRDLKPANCLVNEDCTVKICDFGLARAMGGTAAAAGRLNDAHKAEKRHLTGHVVTRWYRAPELILLQESYTEAIDMWSVGCIYAELLGMLEGTKYKNRGPLFPGMTCFPLSPNARHTQDTKFYTNGRDDQLAMICDLIGCPTEEDIMKLEGEDAQTYLKCYKSRTGSGVKAKFGSLDRLGAELLERMLVFSAEKRISAAEALRHALFAKVKNPKKEAMSKTIIKLPFEEEEALDEHRIRKYFLDEVRRYHPEVPDCDAPLAKLGNGLRATLEGDEKEPPSPTSISL